MKNYVREDQKLPIFGVGPYLIVVLALLTLAGIFMSGNIFKAGNLEGAWVWIFRILGVFFIVMGVVIWYIGAVKSEMDESIIDNRLKTDGIYAWVRNPMYSGWWMLITGIGLMWHNVLLVIIPVLNLVIMTVVIINTEEKWLNDVYGENYAEYKKKVNRFIPWFPHI